MHPSELIQNHDGAISCYIGQVPDHVDDALVATYASLHSCLAFFRVFRSVDKANCYLARRAGAISTVLLFTCHGRRIEILNEMIEVERAEMQRFVDFIFRHFPQVDVVSFRAVKTTTHGFGFPLQRHSAKSTYVVALPATPDAYTARIGKSTRAGIRQGLNTIGRKFPSFQPLFFSNGEIEETTIRAIVAWSEQKISAGGAAFFYDVDRIITLARACGFVSVLLIDGRICAGSVNYQVGSSFFGDVTGYDPAYEKYSLGKLCAYLTICESIRRGGQKFYLGGGVFAFKERLLGVPLMMDALHIYRSPLKVLTNLDNAAGVVIAAWAGAGKNLLHRHKQATWARSVFNAFYFFRSLRLVSRWTDRVASGRRMDRDK